MARLRPQLAALSIVLLGTGSRSCCAFRPHTATFLTKSTYVSKYVAISSVFPTSASSTTALRFSSSDNSSMKKRVLIPISDGSEEIETTCIQDTLARFGAEVVIASCKPHGDLKCVMSRGIKILADTMIEDAVKLEWDLVVLPGGMPGAGHLRDCKPLIDHLKKRKAEGQMYAAICASPAVALAPHGLAPTGATCYPADSFRSVIKHASDDDVVVQDNVVTSQGPGTSLKFALTLGERLYGKDKTDQIAKGMLVHRH